MPVTRRRLLTGITLGSLALAGGRSAFAAPLQRIVAINWVAAETLLTLGITPLAISDSRYYRQRMPTTALPPSVLDIGPFWEPNLELIEALAPQLILSDPMPAPIARAMKGIAPTEIVDVYPATDNLWQRATRFMTQLAERTGCPLQAERWIAASDARLAQLRNELARYPCPPLYVAVLNQDGRHAMVYGQHSMVQDVLDQLGLVNAWQGPRGVMGTTLIGIEQLAQRPDAHLLYVEIPTTSARLQSLRQPNALWDNLPAMRKGNALELGKFFPFGGAASALNLAEVISAYLRGQGGNRHA
jgi:ABC-type Fe3+-hydroxamate transport system substrate-binding protein